MWWTEAIRSDADALAATVWHRSTIPPSPSYVTLRSTELQQRQRQQRRPQPYRPIRRYWIRIRPMTTIIPATSARTDRQWSALTESANPHWSDSLWRQNASMLTAKGSEMVSIVLTSFHSIGLCYSMCCSLHQPSNQAKFASALHLRW